MKKIDLSKVPNSSGCYLWKDKEGNIIYIGKAKNLKSRMSNYFSKNVSSKTQILVKHIDSFEYMITKNEIDALLLELNLITKHNPKYNIRLKNEKKYPYISLTLNPKVKVSLSKSYKKNNSIYFGPFPEGFSASSVIKILKSIYPINECKSPGSKKPCLNYQLGLCMGYCIGQVKLEEKQKVFNSIKSFLEGKTKSIINELNKKIEYYSSIQDYEQALLFKNNIQILKQYKEKQSIYFKDSLNRDAISYSEDNGLISISITYVRYGKVIDTKNNIIKSFTIDPIESVEQYLIGYYQKNIIPNEIILSFNSILEESLETNFIINPKSGLRYTILESTIKHSQEYLKSKGTIFDIEDQRIEKSIMELENILDISINEIEMIDISHMDGKNQVGGIVNFIHGKPNRNMYRKYKLKDGNDDYKNIYEITLRHFKSKLENNIQLPSLYIVDGKNQIFNAEKAVKELNIINEITIVGLIKNDHHKTESLFLLSREVIKLTNELKSLLGFIQYEVHRFSISFQRKQRTIK